MPRRSQNPFEKALSAHQSYVDKTPVTPGGLMHSLSSVYNSGESQIQAGDLGKVRFANQIAPLYSGALILNTEGLVQPPLSEAQVAEIGTKQQVLSLFTEGNGQTGRQGPTDPNAIPTAERK